MTIHKATIALVCLLSVTVFTACGGATQSIDDPRAEDKEASKVLTPLIPNGTPKPEPPSPHAPTEASSPVPSPTSKSTPVPSNMGVQVQSASQPQVDEAEPENDGGNDTQTLENWRELYQIAYKTSCLDDRLGVAIVRKFQTGERGPTDAEFETIKT
ncbi:MAG: hypothetical protein QGF12_06955, partial [SAR202 cluster bacterium]|nr:hypothetical protein [SAR202 cluster bacterium]